MSQALTRSGWGIVPWNEAPPHTGGASPADVAIVESGVLAAGSDHVKAGTPIVVLVSGEDDPYWTSCRGRRVAGIIDRDDPDHGFVAAVREVLSGRGWLSPELVPHVLAGVPAGPRRRPIEVPGGERLTDRERDVALLVAEGLSNLEIAEELTVGLSTVKFHVSNVLRKLRCRDRSRLVAVIHVGGHTAGNSAA